MRVKIKLATCNVSSIPTVFFGGEGTQMLVDLYVEYKRCSGVTPVYASEITTLVFGEPYGCWKTNLINYMQDNTLFNVLFLQLLVFVLGPYLAMLKVYSCPWLWAQGQSPSSGGESIFGAGCLIGVGCLQDQKHTCYIISPVPPLLVLGLPSDLGDH